MPKVVDRSEFLTAAAAEGFGSGSTLTRQQVKDVAAKHGVTLPRWLLNDEQYRASRGVYMLPSADQASAPAPAAPAPVPLQPLLPLLPLLRYPVRRDRFNHVVH